jgi:NADH:ubiquinone oxidoreductase subunit 4 (subunit M)
MARTALPVRGISQLDRAAAIHYHLGVDGISLFLVLLTTFLTPHRDSVLLESIHET